MPDNQHIFEPGIYFLTFTNYKWLPLFDVTNSYDLVYNWFDILKEKQHELIGYVIMPNHLHALIGFKPADKSINTIVGNGKRFIAYDIVDRLEKANNTGLLTTLAAGVSMPDRAKGQKHEVYEGTFDIKLCYSLRFLQQKLNYIHSNPVSKKWSLAKEPIEYLHSSALFYETGVQGIYPVTHINEWIENNWYDSEKYRLKENEKQPE